MEERSPYRIYDPGGTAPNRLATLRQNMDGILGLGELLEESKNVAFTLRQKAEALVKDNLHSPPSPAPQSYESMDVNKQEDHFVHVQMENVNYMESSLRKNQKPPASGSSSEFEILDHSERKKPIEARMSDPGPTVQHEDENLHHHLQRMENSLSMFAEESDRNRLLSHMSRMALEFNRLATKVHKNEMRTSVLQTLCEQLRKENEDLKSKLEADLKHRSQADQALRFENLELKKLILDKGKVSAIVNATPTVEDFGNVENSVHQQAAKLLEKPPIKDQSGALLKKVKVLEHQRAELLEVNKQWDQQFRSMKLQYEEKITSLRQKLTQANKNESEQEVERDRKQRDFDRKLLLARDKIQDKESQIQKLECDIRDLKQKNKFLHDQLNSTTKQRDYQEREISRLNKALEDVLKLQESGPHSPFSARTEDMGFLQRQELLTEIGLLKQQVTIFEEDFKRERSDRERMNEEKEELKQQLEQTQTQLARVNTQLHSCQDDLRQEREGSHNLSRQQAIGEIYIQDHHTGPTCPPYQYPYSPPGLMYPGMDDWQICYPPPVVAPEHSQVQDIPNAPPPAYQWRNPIAPSRPPHQKAPEIPHSRKKEQDGPKRGTHNAKRPT